MHIPGVDINIVMISGGEDVRFPGDIHTILLKLGALKKSGNYLISEADGLFDRA